MESPSTSRHGASHSAHTGMPGRAHFSSLLRHEGSWDPAAAAAAAARARSARPMEGEEEEEGGGTRLAAEGSAAAGGQESSTRLRLLKTRMPGGSAEAEAEGGFGGVNGSSSDVVGWTFLKADQWASKRLDAYSLLAYTLCAEALIQLINCSMV